MANPFKKPKMPKIEINKDPQRIPGDNMLALQKEELEKERKRQREQGRISTVLYNKAAGVPRILGG